MTKSVERVRHLEESRNHPKIHGHASTSGKIGTHSKRPRGVETNPELATSDVGKLLAGLPLRVTHCYEAHDRSPGRWEYTHYTVHHGYRRDQVLETIRAIAEQPA